MEETTQKLTTGALEASPSRLRCNMERTSGEGKNVDTMSLACLSRTHARHPANGDWCVDGNDRLLLERVCDR